MNCQQCGAEDADYVVDPYTSEFADKDTPEEDMMEWLCPDCYTDSVQSI